MDKWLSGFSIGVAVSLSAFFGKRLWQFIIHRFIKKSTKPNFSLETSMHARATLNRAKYTFHSANSCGGHLTHPWKDNYDIDDEKDTFKLTEIEAALDAASSHINDKKFSEYIRTITKQLYIVYAAGKKFVPMVLYDGKPASASEVENYESREKFASLQREAAVEGLTAASAAVLRLNELSKNL